MAPANQKRLLAALLIATPIVVTLGYFVDLSWLVVVGILLLGWFAGFKSPERDFEAEQKAYEDDSMWRWRDNDDHSKGGYWD